LMLLLLLLLLMKTRHTCYRSVGRSACRPWSSELGALAGLLLLQLSNSNTAASGVCQYHCLPVT